MTDTLIILAGGASSRMKNSIDSNLSPEKSAQANNRSKGLIEINGKPFLSYLLDNVLKAGFKNVIIITGENSELFRSTYDKNEEFVSLNIKFATQYIPKERVKPFGTADAVYQSIIQYPELKNKKFCVCNSDNLYSLEVFRLLRKSNYEQALIAYDRDRLLYPKERISKFAIMGFTKNYQLTEIIEKPDQGKISEYVDKKNKVVDLIYQDTENLRSNNLFKNLEVVIMAGGLGTRLRPYTNILPKPLIPFNKKTIIENIIDYFLKYDLKNFYISINYKNYLISSFFKELKPSYKIKFLYEKKPLGTAGVLQKLKNKKEKIFVVSNCDSLIDINLKDLIDFHKKNNFDLTIVSSSEIYKIPYGVCKIVNNRLSNIIEKPQSDFLANTGFYVVNSKIFSLIKKNQSLSFVELIKISLRKKKKIGVFPISSSNWKDLGQSINFEKK